MVSGSRSGLWRLAESYSAQIIQFIVQIVLTRVLLPNDFAAMAVLMVMISLGSVLVEGGLSSALVQRPSVDEADRTSAFYLSVSVAAGLYVITFASAPGLASLYAVPVLEPTLRVCGLLFFFGAYNSVQISIAVRQFQFRAMMISRFSSQLIAGLAAIVAASAGLGVWSLVILNVVGGALNCVVLSWFVRWRPGRRASSRSAKELLAFGWRILLGGVLYNGYMGLLSLMLGRLPDSRVLGYFDRGRQIPSFLVNTFNTAICSVAFPYFSRMQERREAVRSAMDRALRLSAAISVPSALGLVAIAEPLVEVVLGTRWLPAAFFLRLWAIYFLFSPLANVNQQAMKAIGRAHTYLRCELLEVLVGVLLVVSLWHWGGRAMMIGVALSGFFGALIHATPSGTVFGFSAVQQLRRLWAVFLASGVMMVLVLLIGRAALHPLPLLLAQVVSGIFFYAVTMELLRASELRELVALFKSAMTR